jgi:hypothetical protein
MPWVCGCFETTDSTAYTTSRLECGFVTAKFKRFLSTASSEFVRIYLERLRINLLEAKARVGKTILLIVDQGELKI